MKLKAFSKNPAPKHIDQIADILNNSGLVIIPTDGVYAFACRADKPQAIEKLSAVKGQDFNPSKLSFVFSDLSQVGAYTKPLTNATFKLMNRLLPGPFTFILNADNKVGKIFPGKKSIGIRIPQHEIPLSLVRSMGTPILTTSVHDDDEIIEYTTDPEKISAKWENKVDLVVDGGYGNNEPSTVLDCTGKELTMIRQGIGQLEESFA